MNGNLLKSIDIILKKKGVTVGINEKRPEVHCRQVKSELLALESLGEEKKKRVLSQLSKDTFQAIEKAKEDEWLPLAVNLELVACALAELGEAEVRQLGMKSFTLSINSFVVGPFFRTAINLFKTKPSTVFKLGPQIWKAIHRHCGELAIVEKDKHTVRILLNNMPLEMASSHSYLIGIAGCFQAVLALSAVEGKVVLEKQSDKDHSAVYLLSWR